MIRSISPYLAKKFTLEDPVRPNISGQFRATCHREMFVLYNDEFDKNKDDEYHDALAVLCVAYCNSIPITEEELKETHYGDNAIFYAVWSRNGSGAGRRIIFDVWDILKERDNITRYITMSPKTKLAKMFHLRNGAELIVENDETYNFEYK
jgi:hypothetical protein